jgi:hypothetical protein
MGGSRKSSPDTVKRPPVNILTEVRRLEKGLGDSGNAGAYRAESFCAQPRNISFQVLDGTSIEAGDPIRLRLADPPQVFRGDKAVGELSEVSAKAMLACLKMGYQMVGKVDSVSADGRTGFLSIRGERSKVA